MRRWIIFRVEKDQPELKERKLARTGGLTKN